jgi:hypothetical protein
MTHRIMSAASQPLTAGGAAQHYRATRITTICEGRTGTERLLAEGQGNKPFLETKLNALSALRASPALAFDDDQW